MGHMTTPLEAASHAIDEAIKAAETPRTRRIGPDDATWDDGYLNGIKACGTVVLAAIAAAEKAAPVAPALTAEQVGDICASMNWDGRRADAWLHTYGSGLGDVREAFATPPKNGIRVEPLFGLPVIQRVIERHTAAPTAPKGAL